MFTAVLGIADKLGILRAVKSKLLAQPDPAAERLVVVLDEIYKIYAALEAELVAYLSLWVEEDNPELKRERRALLRLDGEEITARMAPARGSCTKITNIYEKYLTAWFTRVLNKDEAKQIAGLFREMNTFDSEMVDAIEELAVWLTNEAGTTLDLFDSGQLSAAQHRVTTARNVVKEDRQAIASAMRDLVDLQSEFIEISGAI